MKYFLTAVSLIFLWSCQQSQQKSSEFLEKGSTPSDTEITPGKALEEQDITLLEKLEVKGFPFVDSTNFDNDNSQGVKSAELINRIGFKVEHVKTQDIRIRYRLAYSPSFYSFVITYPIGEHELVTTILNVNKEGKILDFLDVAYDEIAESAFRKESKFDKKKITLTDWNYMSEEPTKTVTTYTLNKSGEFEESGETVS